MKKDIKDKWVEALRSGKYKQCTGALCRVYYNGCAYCCLGVLADTLNLPNNEEKAYDSHDCEEKYKTYDGRDCNLTDARLAEIELTSNQQAQLIDLNDNDKRDFNYIAGWIEENL